MAYAGVGYWTAVRSASSCTTLPAVYPIEIDLARAIASGKAVTDVTWGVVAEMNAKHAHDQAGVTKAAALELLRGTVVRRPPPYARSRMTSWTGRRPSR